MNGNIYNIDDRRQRPHNDRPLSETLNDAKTEAKAFIETRIAMLRSELKDKVAMVKVAAPLLFIGAIFGVSAWFALTAALVTLVMVAFQPSPFAPFLACIIVGVVYAGTAAIALWIAKGRLSSQSLMPERTMTVLKEDKVWLQNEARNQL